MKFISKLVLLFTLFYYVNGFDYTCTYNSGTNKLVYTSISPMNKVLTRIDLLDDKNQVTSNIKFTCVIDQSTKSNVCSSDKLDPKNLIATKISFYGKDSVSSQEVSKNDGSFPIPLPNVKSFDLPPTAGGNVLITGDLLRFAQGDPSFISAIINGKTVKVPLALKTGYDASSFQLVFPAGSGKIVLKFSNKYFNYNYKAPTISNISGIPGSYIIEGTNFFTDVATVEVQSNSKKIGTVKSVSDGKITLDYIPQYAEIDSVSILINTIPSAESYSWKLVPIPQNVDDSLSIAKSTGGDLKIVGKRLSPPPSDSSSSSAQETIKTTVMVGEQNCEFKSSTSDSIICTLPKALNGQYADQKIQVTIGDLASTNEAKFSYDIKPTVKNITQDQFKFTITGFNLGLSGSTINITPKGGAAQDITEDIVYSDENSLSFKLPTNVYLCDLKVKTADGESAPVEFRAAPIINSNVLTSPPTKGGKLVLSGSYLDPALAGAITIDVTNQNSNGQSSCDNVAIDPNGNLSCDMQAGTGSKISASIKISDSKFNVDFSYQAPSDIKVVSQKGNQLEIEGVNLGNNASLINLKVGSSDRLISASSLNEDQTKAIFTLPDDVTSSKNSVLMVDGVKSESPIELIIKPNCKSIQKSNTEGQDIIISGSFFDSSSTFKIGLGSDSNLLDASVVNATALKVLAPKGSGVNKKVVIQYNGEPLADGNELLFSYNAPTIISSTSIMDSKGGEITIYGTNFAQTNASAIVDQKECKNITVVSSNSLKCTLPPQGKNETAPIKGKKYPITVSIDSQSVTENKFEYNNEAINTVPPELTKPPVTKPPVTPTKKAEPTEHPTETPNNSSNILSHYNSSILLIFISIIINLIY